MNNQATELAAHALENTSETMRDVMADLGHHKDLPNPTAETALTSATLVTLPNHRKIENLTELHRNAAQFLKPARRKGTARLEDLQSLIAWTNRFKGETSALFANPDLNAPSLTCVADYHAEGAIDVKDNNGDPSARHCHHRAIYNFPLSDEWKAWMKVSTGGNNGQPVMLGKDQLGEFIEAQAKDIMDPTPAVIKGEVSDKNEPWENRLIETARRIEGRFGQLNQLLAMSKQFQVYETSDLTVSTNRDTGEAEIQFLNEHKTKDGQPLKIPNLIIIAIPVFQNGAPYRMPVRFRYRKIGGEVKFILSVYNPEKAFDASFKEALTQAQEETKLPLFMGSPES